MATEIKRTANGFALKREGYVIIYTAPYKAMVYPIQDGAVIQINDGERNTVVAKDAIVNGTPFTGDSETLVDLIAFTVVDTTA